MYVIWKIGVYTSPFLVGILYQKGYFTIDGLGPFTKLVTSISVILVVSYWCKGLGRLNNSTYVRFLNTLEAAKKDMTPEIKQQLSIYDFEFHSWPVEFDMSTYKRWVIQSLVSSNLLNCVVCRDSTKSNKTVLSKPSLHQNVIQYVSSIPLRIIAYVAIHTFGIRLIYPGSIGILQMILGMSWLMKTVKNLHIYSQNKASCKVDLDLSNATLANVSK